MTSGKLQQMSRNLLEKYVLDCTHSAFTKITCILISPLPLWSSFSELSEVLSPRLHQVEL